MFVQPLSRASPLGLVVKTLSANAEDTRDAGSIPGVGRSPGEGHGKPLQYSCLENPVDKGAWRATVHGIVKSQDMTDGLCTRIEPGTELGARQDSSPRGCPVCQDLWSDL